MPFIPISGIDGFSSRQWSELAAMHRHQLHPPFLVEADTNAATFLGASVIGATFLAIGAFVFVQVLELPNP